MGKGSAEIGTVQTALQPGRLLPRRLLGKAGVHRRLPTVLLGLLLAGCALRPIQPEPVSVEIAATPFFVQEAWHCGPASLAMLLVHAGVEITPDALAAQVYLPARQGSLQLELVAATRRAGRLPYRLPEDPAAIQAALLEGYPVLVLQNLGSRHWPRWHYAVAIGRDSRGGWLLRSGEDFRRRMSDRRFRAVWRRGGHWALVAMTPSEVPGFARADRFVEAAAGFEAVALLEPAEVAYRAALERWPDSFVARLGLGNVAYLRGDRAGAQGHYRIATALDPDHPAGWNNLATVLGELGRCEDALAALAKGEAAATPAFVEALAETRQTLNECH